jgi:hypothetical protein
MDKVAEVHTLYYSPRRLIERIRVHEVYTETTASYTKGVSAVSTIDNTTKHITFHMQGTHQDLA